MSVCICVYVCVCQGERDRERERERRTSLITPLVSPLLLCIIALYFVLISSISSMVRVGYHLFVKFVISNWILSITYLKT